MERPNHPPDPVALAQRFVDGEATLGELHEWAMQVIVCEAFDEDYDDQGYGMAFFDAAAMRSEYMMGEGKLVPMPAIREWLAAFIGGDYQRYPWDIEGWTGEAAAPHEQAA